MAHIYVFSPSGAVFDKVGFRRAVKRLQAQGHEVEIDPDALSRHQRFAGDDDTRLAAIARATASGADLALISRGGYGLTRILPRIDYAAVAQAIDRGTQFMGFSDFTAFQLAVLSQTGRSTWSGPALIDSFGQADEPDEITQACFDDVLCGQAEGAGWQMPKADVALALGAQAEQGLFFDDATLWGGNLAVLCAMVGSPYLPAVEGGVLFLEDVAEAGFRIERMLTQLLHAGVLSRQRAIVLGQFTDMRPGPYDKGYTLKTIVAWLRSQLSVPVFTGLPYGHVATKLCLPVGPRIEFAVEGREAFMVWPHPLHATEAHSHGDGDAAHAHDACCGHAH